MNIPNNPLIKTVPAAAQLRRVSGFNPLKFLRQTTSEKTGQTVLKLDLPYKRLWFRLACPNGRMLLNPLRITDQLAIFEAMVYMNKDDAEPLSRVTSTATAAEAPNGKYIESAQDSALNEALENAGFGIQLCDLIENDGQADYGSEIILDANAAVQVVTAEETPAATNEAVAAPSVVKASGATAPATAPATTTASASATTPVPVPATASASATAQTPAQASAMASITATPSVEQVQSSNMGATVKTAENAEFQASPETAPVASATPAGAAAEKPAPPSDTGEAASITPLEAVAQALSGKLATASGTEVAQTVIQFPTPAPAEEAPPMPQTTAQAAPSAAYTADMSVEEIVEKMTLDEAKAVVVTNGTCKGWTIAQVAERRAPSLRFYVCSPTVDNVLKAAAQIMLDANQRKAG